MTYDHIKQYSIFCNNEKIIDEGYYKIALKAIHTVNSLMGSCVHNPKIKLKNNKIIIRFNVARSKNND